MVAELSTGRQYGARRPHLQAGAPTSSESPRPLRKRAARVSSFAAKMMYESSELLNVERPVWTIESPSPVSGPKVTGTLMVIGFAAPETERLLASKRPLPEPPIMENWPVTVLGAPRESV